MDRWTDMKSTCIARVCVLSSAGNLEALREAKRSRIVATHSVPTVQDHVYVYRMFKDRWIDRKIDKKITR